MWSDETGEPRLRAVANRASLLQPLGLVEILLLARERDAIDLASGSASFPETIDNLLDYACTALRSGFNQYDDPAGNAGLRAAAAAIHHADPDKEITITAGSTEALNVVLQSLVQPGDEVVVLEPYYEGYPGAIRLTGAVPRYVRLHEPGWRWDADELAAAFNERTRAIIINSPHNPTGRVFTQAELTEIFQLCATWNTVIISDEVYAEFVSRPDELLLPSRAADAASRVVTLRSMSKSHAIGGWRLGWICAAAPFTRIFRIVHETLTAGVAAPLQVAAAQILRERPGWSPGQRAMLEAKRREIVSVLTDAGLTYHMPEGSPYVLARMPGHWGDSTTFAQYLITEVGVSAAPGVFFFSRPSEGAKLLRFSYNKSDPLIAVAAERIRSLGYTPPDADHSRDVMAR